VNVFEGLRLRSAPEAVTEGTAPAAPAALLVRLIKRLEVATTAPFLLLCCCIGLLCFPVFFPVFDAEEEFDEKVEGVCTTDK